MTRRPAGCTRSHRAPRCGHQAAAVGGTVILLMSTLHPLSTEGREGEARWNDSLADGYQAVREKSKAQRASWTDTASLGTSHVQGHIADAGYPSRRQGKIMHSGHCKTQKHTLLIPLWSVAPEGRVGGGWLRPGGEENGRRISLPFLAFPLPFSA